MATLRADPARLEPIDRYLLNLTPQRPLAVNEGFSAEPDAAVRMDMHYELELGIVLRGCLYRGFENFEMSIEPGDVWLCGIWEPHACRVLKAPCARVVVTILPQMLAEMRTPEVPGQDWLAPFRLPPAERPRVPKPRRGELLAVARRMLATLKLPAPDQALWQRVLLVEILLKLRRPGDSATSPGDPRFSDRIGRAVELVFSSRGIIGAAAAAAQCGISRSRFDAVFQKTMGLSFARFALRYRLSSAAVQLLQHNEPMKSIAADWGFTDASHFNRAFYDHYGCTPGAYRELNARA